MRNILHSFIFFIIGLMSCSRPNDKSNVNVISDTLTISHSYDRVPKVDLKISLGDSVINYSDSILINVHITNAGKKDQRLLFDKPVITTGGPWATSGEVISKRTNKSVLEYRNKAMLSSELHSEEQLKNYYYYLKPGQTIKGQYELRNIVVFKTKDNLLPRGTYDIQLFYYDNPSNIVTLVVK